MTCEEVRLALGAHALGALEPDEALELDTHLATCEACGAELLELEGVASFLGKVSERDIELVASPPRQVLDRLLNARAKRSRRGRLLLVAAASVALLGLGGTVWTVVQESRMEQGSAAMAPADAKQPAASEAAPDTYAQNDQSSSAELSAREPAKPMPTPKASASAGESPEPLATKAPEKAVPGREFTGENPAKHYYATVMTWPSDGGTDLGVQVSGVPVGTRCRLVVVGKDGRRESTDSWTISRQTYEDNAPFKSATSLPMSDIARFDVVNRSGRVLISVPVRK